MDTENIAIRVNRIIKQTRAEGFGNRYSIWFQGCSIRCPGCANQEMWDQNGGNVYLVSDILQDIAEQGDKIEGITILGGEPFDQRAGLAALTGGCKKLGYSVIVFTGFIYERLLAHGDKVLIGQILKNTDLLIDGPYAEEKKDLSRPWIGSSNQRYLFLTSRYSKEELRCNKNRWEIRISTEGKLEINGMGDYTIFDTYL